MLSPERQAGGRQHRGTHPGRPLGQPPRRRRQQRRPAAGCCGRGAVTCGLIWSECFVRGGRGATQGSGGARAVAGGEQGCRERRAALTATRSMAHGEIGATQRANRRQPMRKSWAEGAIKNPSGRGGRANGSHHTTMTLAYALPAARSALPPCRSASRAPHLRSRRVAVRAASDQPFDLQQHLEATVAE